MNRETFDIALAIIRHPTDDAYLIALRKTDAHLGAFWEFPGGKCRAGEGLAECAVREAFEEVGLTVMVEEAWPPVAFAYPERDVILYPFLCRAETGEARPLANRAVAWVAPIALSLYSFPPANAPLLDRLVKPANSPTESDPV